MVSRNLLLTGLAILMSGALMAKPAPKATASTSNESTRFSLFEGFDDPKPGDGKPDGKPGCNCGGGGGCAAKALKAIVYTDAQMDQIKGIIDAAKPNIAALIQKAEAAEKAFMEAIKAGTSTPEQLKALYLEAQGAAFEVTMAERAGFKAIDALLTEEQKKQIKTYNERLAKFTKLFH